jgi:hypothetical protein
MANVHPLSFSGTGAGAFMPRDERISSPIDARWTIADLTPLFVLCCFCLLPSSTGWGADPVPLTAAEAAKRLDLRTLPVPADTGDSRQRTIASLFYEAPGSIETIYPPLKTELQKRGWKELPEAMVTPAYASATYQNKDSRLSLTLSPAGDKVTVMMNQHGNIALDKLPMPKGVQTLYAGPVSLLLTATDSPEKTHEAVSKLLLAKGWQPYGSAGDTRFYRQNAVRLGVTASAAPAQGGKTMIQLESTLMSVELPAPKSAEGLSYADVTTTISFDSAEPLEAIDAFYRKTLAPAGWEATTENPIKVSIYDTVIFRNPAKDLIELRMQTVEGKSRAMVIHQSAAQVAEIEAAAEKAVKKKTAPTEKGKLAVTLPAGAMSVEASAATIEFAVKSGAAKSTVSEMIAAWKKDGWTAEATVNEAQVGQWTIKKGNQELSVNYVDPGFIPGEITIQATGVTLSVAGKPEGK